MKFVCDNCQAKYQIGDDKVAGKTVRMKCRKCGYNIKVTPAGAPDAPSVDAPSHEVEAPRPAHVPPAPVAHAPAPAAPAPPAGRAPWGNDDDESTAIMNAPLRDAVAAAIAQKPAAPRPVTTAAHPPRPVTAAAAPRPYAPPGRTVPGVGGNATPAPRPVTRGSSTSSMAAVHHEPTPHGTSHAALQAAAHAEGEWYVGVHGTPIGPVGVSVIRERAAAREVDGDSLVWREGQGEWKALRNFPELLEVVTAAQRPAAPPTRTPLAVAAAPAPPPAPAPLAVAAAPAPPPAPAPLAAAPAPAPAPTPAPAPAATPTPAPLAAAPAPAPAPLAAAAAAAKLAATPAPASTPAPVVVADPFAAPAASPFGAGPAATPQNGKANGVHHANGALAPVATSTAIADTPAPAVPAADVTKPAPQAIAPKAPSFDIDPALEEKLVPRRSNTHPMAYAFIAAAAVFGGVAAYVLLIKPPAQPQVVYVTTPGTAATTAPKASASADDKTEPQVEVGELTTPGSARPVAKLGGPMPKASSTSAASTAAPIDTSGFVSNVPGPSTAAPPSPGGGGQLSAGEIQGVVSSNQALVKRKCWQPALEAASATAPKTARVNGSITIGASGSVESASASGAEKDYPGLSSCIAARMKNWKFPAAGGSQQVNVPFVFAGQ